MPHPNNTRKHKMTIESPKTVKGHCPECKGNRHSDILAHHEYCWEDEGAGVNGCSDYRILKCRGCDAIYFQKQEICSEDWHPFFNAATDEWDNELVPRITYWPAPSKKESPEWVTSWDLGDKDLSDLLESVYIALNNDLRILAAIGIRTAFDRASELLGINPNKYFIEKLNELIEKGKIGKEEQEVLKVLTDAGSAAAHRGWKPSVKELDTMISIIESFLYRNFILHKKTKVLETSVPQKAKKKKPTSATKKVALNKKISLKRK